MPSVRGSPGIAPIEDMLLLGSSWIILESSRLRFEQSQLIFPFLGVHFGNVSNSSRAILNHLGSLGIALAHLGQAEKQTQS